MGALRQKLTDRKRLKDITVVRTLIYHHQDAAPDLFMRVYVADDGKQYVTRGISDVVREWQWRDGWEIWREQDLPPNATVL
jgi:hypothetical protein